MNTRARPTAFHEAGHALAFWWNERPIERVTVRTQAEAASGPMLDLLGNLQQVEGLVEASYFVLRPSGEAPVWRNTCRRWWSGSSVTYSTVLPAR